MTNPTPCTRVKGLARIEALVQLVAIKPSVAEGIAFTFNPNPQNYTSHNPSSQWAQALNCMRCKRLPDIFENYIFVPELTMQGNVHVHGWYIVKDDDLYHNYWLPTLKRHGLVLLKANKPMVPRHDDEQHDAQHMYAHNSVNDGWLDYIYEDVPLMDTIMEKWLPISVSPLNYQQYDHTWTTITTGTRYCMYIPVIGYRRKWRRPFK